ncbi:MAG TPA: hypothetical protein VIK86_01045 [Candidatus Paceibacterota bacterium]
MRTFNSDYLFLPSWLQYLKETEVVNLRVGNLITLETIDVYKNALIKKEIIYRISKIEEVSEHLVVSFNFYGILEWSMVSMFIKKLFFGIFSYSYGPKSDIVISFSRDPANWNSESVELYKKSDRVKLITKFMQINNILLIRRQVTKASN